MKLSSFSGKSKDHGKDDQEEKQPERWEKLRKLVSDAAFMVKLVGAAKVVFNIIAKLWRWLGF